MPVVDVKQSTDRTALTIIADFAAPMAAVWGIYADPRKLEKVWGPPEYPATFVDHDLSPGGRMNYYLTSPEGERFCGYWRIATVSAPDSFEFADGFADAAFNPNPELPESENVYSFAAHDGGTRATFVATYASAEALQQVLEMGMIEGATSAIAQIDGLLAAA